VSEYAVQFTQGMQESPDDDRYIQASACCKHFIANTMEATTQPNGESENRGSVNSNVTQQDLLDSYMPAFQACVEKGKVTGLMCSCTSLLTRSLYTS
jgi:pre-mRNA-splicing factor SYF2/beta-D-xylosidase 4